MRLFVGEVREEYRYALVIFSTYRLHNSLIPSDLRNMFYGNTKPENYARCIRHYMFLAKLFF
jgi:hypothetical protein